MRIIVTWIVFLFSIVVITTPAAAATSPLVATTNVPPGDIYKKIASLTIKDVQHLIGRKLTIKEKIGFLAIKHKTKRQAKDGSQGQTALIFGIGALALLVIGLFVPYVIIGALIAAILAIVTGSVAKKQNPSDGKARAGKLLGWITLGLITLLLILAVAIIATWTWG